LEAMSEKHNKKYCAVEDQRFWAKKKYGEEISRAQSKPQCFRHKRETLTAGFSFMTRADSQSY
jgi:hypothetical protein